MIWNPLMMRNPLFWWKLPRYCNISHLFENSTTILQSNFLNPLMVRNSLFSWILLRYCKGSHIFCEHSHHTKIKLRESSDVENPPILVKSTAILQKLSPFLWWLLRFGNQTSDFPIFAECFCDTVKVITFSCDYSGDTLKVITYGESFMDIINKSITSVIWCLLGAIYFVF